jgi:hypothetical protein
MTTNKLPDDVLGYECRFAVYCPPPEPGMPDLHVVKELIHYKDGTKKPNLRLWKDFKRPFYVTKQQYRNHKDKKEWEDLDKVNVFESTQTDLIWNAAGALGNRRFRGTLKQLAMSPYLYGADILSTAVLKRTYQDKFPGLNTPFSSATFDIETDVNFGTGAVLCAATAHKNVVHTAIAKSFVEGYANVVEQLQKLLKQYLGDIVEKRGLVWNIDIVDDEVMAIRSCFNQIHKWEPDFLSIWNMNFDIKRVEERLKANNVDPAEVFSDPRVPKPYQFFKYKEGPSKKVTASGKESPIKPAARWHTLFTPASFYVIDAMCAYRHIRNQKAEEQSYSLDAILNKEIKRGKLTFPNITTVTEGTLEWHQEMQAKHPLEYIVYNLFDCVGMQELDEKINDLSLTLPMFSGCSDFQNFKSQPRRMADDLHYFCLQNNKVIATTADELKVDFDKLTPDTDGWIVTLPAELVMDNGLRVIKDAPAIVTNFRAHVGDLDVSASYPNGEEVMNISKETTHRELCSIEGIPDKIRRMQGINLSGGATNAVEICTMLFGLPEADTLLHAFKQHIAQGA